jgi:ABC-type uncharacterized transport system permease subunit
MSKKTYCIIAVLILIGVVGLVSGQMSGTKPAETAVVPVKEETQPLTIEERILILSEKQEELAKNQERILAELKEIKENQVLILDQTKKIFTRMKKK